MAPDYNNKDFPQYKAPPLDAHFHPGTDKQALDLLGKIL